MLFLKRSITVHTKKLSAYYFTVKSNFLFFNEDWLRQARNWLKWAYEKDKEM